MLELSPIIQETTTKFYDIPLEEWDNKPNPDKWSRKEILGHLIDSAINNLQRFTEVSYNSESYQVRGYSQDHLVRANKYQQSNLQELITLWEALNKRIAYIMDIQTDDTLSRSITLPNGESTDLRWLMEDYIDHLNHHLRQIL